MIYLSINSGEGRPIREMEIDQFQAEMLVEVLKVLNTDYAQNKRLTEFFKDLKHTVNVEVEVLTDRVTQDQQMLRNITYRPA